jgi:hypothetical protein
LSFVPVGKEKDLLDYILKTGTSMAKEFANVRFPFTPFMNDVLFEDARYDRAGSSFMFRRIGSDFAKFHEVTGKFGTLMANIGAAKPEEILKVMGEAIDAIASPRATPDGQKALMPFLEAYLRMIEAGGQFKEKDLQGGSAKERVERFVQGFMRWFAKDNLTTELDKGLSIKNSLAQIYYGPNAPALTEYDMIAFLNTAVSMGVISRKVINSETGELEYFDIYKELRKKFRVSLIWKIIAILRDVPKIAVVGAVGAVMSKAGGSNKK